MSRRGYVLAALMVATVVAAEAGRPTQRIADLKPPIALETQVPKSFGEWQVDESIIPLVPSPDVQARVDALYSQTLARTYRNAAGQRVMLSIAYGSDQSSEVTQVHRPEFCYSAQGFRVRGAGEGAVELESHRLVTQRLVGKLGGRTEPITYWITLDDKVTLPGFGRKVQQMKFGLRGKIPDGMLVRVSSLTDDEAGAFRVQEQFVKALFGSLPADFRPRYFGT